MNGGPVRTSMIPGAMPMPMSGAQGQSTLGSMSYASGSFPPNLPNGVNPSAAQMQALQAHHAAQVQAQANSMQGGMQNGMNGMHPMGGQPQPGQPGQINPALMRRLPGGGGGPGPGPGNPNAPPGQNPNLPPGAQPGMFAANPQQPAPGSSMLPSQFPGGGVPGRPNPNLGGQQQGGGLPSTLPPNAPGRPMPPGVVGGAGRGMIPNAIPGQIGGPGGPLSQMNPNMQMPPGTYSPSYLASGMVY